MTNKHIFLFISFDQTEYVIFAMVTKKMPEFFKNSKFKF